MDFLQNHAGELIVGLVLGIFGFSFRSWAQALIAWKGTVERSTNRVFSTIETLAADYANHKLEAERRITRLESKLEEIEHLCQDNRRRHDQLRDGRK